MGAGAVRQVYVQLDGAVVGILFLGSGEVILLRIDEPEPIEVRKGAGSILQFQGCFHHVVFDRLILCAPGSRKSLTTLKRKEQLNSSRLKIHSFILTRSPFQNHPLID